MNKTKKILLILVAVVLGFCLTFGEKAVIRHIREEQIIITNAQTDGKTIVFYKDDCSDCQQVFPMLFRQKLRYHDLVFVNLNQVQNGHFIQEYQLTEVPTIVNQEQRYTGTKKIEIQQFLSKIRKEG